MNTVTFSVCVVMLLCGCSRPSAAKQEVARLLPELEALRAEAAFDQWLNLSKTLEGFKVDSLVIIKGEDLVDFNLRMKDAAFRGKYNRSLGSFGWEDGVAPGDRKTIEGKAVEIIRTLTAINFVGFEVNPSEESITLYKKLNLALVVFPKTGAEETIALYDRYATKGDPRGDAYLKLSDRIFAKTERR